MSFLEDGIVKSTTSGIPSRGEDTVLSVAKRLVERLNCDGANWTNLTPFFDYPPEIRRVMYTTNAIEALNAQLRKVTKKRGAFPTPEAVRKVLYVAIDRASERWTRPVQDWTAALNYGSIVFECRVPE